MIKSCMGVEDDATDDCSIPMVPVDVELHVSKENEPGVQLLEKNLIEKYGDQEPYVGMEFDSESDARSFYNAYARHVGFGIRVNYSHRSRRDRTMIAQQYVCAKEGFRKNKEGKMKHNRANTRVGCNVMIIMRKVSSGKWVVRNFKKNHNHPLVSPTQVQFLRSHKGVSDLINPNMGVHQSKFMPVSSVESVESSSSIGFFELGSKNYIASARQKNLAMGDAQAVLDYLKGMQNKNPSFFMQYKLIRKIV
ncbi:protein FAR1-RELATED SEQUENCE 5-like [Tasmannia lanceolata]|uniref:protein FAR1-RELATED SEQUENCE 5-like n=1 Tax=Tasmannia lanceolata TaxID=3420 RepID=UPI0040647D4E